jgi:hypothetical protein
MAEFDEFAQGVFEEAKRFLEKAKEDAGSEGKTAYLHAALNLAFCALEAHVNSVADDFLTRTDLTPLDIGILAERELRLVDGQYEASKTLKMFRLEDRLQFLHRRFAGKPLDRQASWWSDLKEALDLRNQLAHPKQAPVIQEASVARALNAIIDCLAALYKGVYQADYPAARRGLDSRLKF